MAPALPCRKGCRFRVDHLPGSTEPLLWVADVAVGVIRASRQGSPTPLELLGEHVLEVPTAASAAPDELDRKSGQSALIVMVDHPAKPSTPAGESSMRPDHLPQPSARTEVGSWLAASRSRWPARVKPSMTR